MKLFLGNMNDEHFDGSYIPSKKLKIPQFLVSWAPTLSNTKGNANDDLLPRET